MTRCFTQNEVRFGEAISCLEMQLVARGCSVTFCTKLKVFSISYLHTLYLLGMGMSMGGG